MVYMLFMHVLYAANIDLLHTALLAHIPLLDLCKQTQRFFGLLVLATT